METDDERQLREAIALSLAPPPSTQEDDELQQALALSLQAPPPAAPAPTDEDAELQAALALSLGQSSSGPPPAPAPAPAQLTVEPDEPEPEPTAEALSLLVFGADASPAVLRQWHSQGIQLGAAGGAAVATAGAATAEGALPFGAGLMQEHGGPCAVLSAAQGFLLRRLLFDPEPATAQPRPAWRAEAAAALLQPPTSLVEEACLSGLRSRWIRALHHT